MDTACIHWQTQHNEQVNSLFLSYSCAGCSLYNPKSVCVNYIDSRAISCSVYSWDASFLSIPLNYRKRSHIWNIRWIITTATEKRSLSFSLCSFSFFSFAAPWQFPFSSLSLQLDYSFGCTSFIHSLSLFHSHSLSFFLSHSPSLSLSLSLSPSLSPPLSPFVHSAVTYSLTRVCVCM